jgi:peptidoglycan/LPS O-acetylase OafA/YrhL
VAILVGALRRRRVGLLFVLAGCLTLEAVGTWLLPSFNGMPHPLVRVLAGFVAGAAIFAIGPLRIRGRIPGGSLGIAGLVGFALLVVAVGRIGSDPLRAVVALALAGVVVAGLAGGAGPSIRWLASRPLDYGGRVSYGIYMIHGIVLMIFGALFALLVRTVPQQIVWQWPLIARVGVLLVPLGTVLVLGALLYHLVERPAQQWIGRIADRRRELSIDVVEG